MELTIYSDRWVGLLNVIIYVVIVISSHLNSVHVLDETGASQARVQGYVVKDLEERVRAFIMAYFIFLFINWGIVWTINFRVFSTVGNIISIVGNIISSL